MRLAQLLTLLIALLLTACEVGIEPQSPIAPPESGYPPLPPGLARARVVKVVDGDTIDVALGSHEDRVRLIGINTPETVDPRRPVQCFGQEASENAKAMLAGQAVLLEEDQTQGSRDSSGRLLRYVWLEEDGRMANLEQIALGFAAEYTFDTPYKYRDLFRAAQGRAREAGLGLWAADTCNGQFSPVGAAPAPPPPGGNLAEDTPRCPPAPAGSAAPNAPVRIVGLDKRDEVVRLANLGPDPVDLDGWLLCSVRGGEAQPGLGGLLAPGEVRAFANPADPIWSNSHPDDAALYDPSGRLMSYWADR